MLITFSNLSSFSDYESIFCVARSMSQPASARKCCVPCFFLNANTALSPYWTLRLSLEKVAAQLPFVFILENDGNDCQEGLKTQSTADLVIFQAWVFVGRPFSKWIGFCKTAAA